MLRKAAGVGAFVASAALGLGLALQGAKTEPAAPASPPTSTPAPAAAITEGKKDELKLVQVVFRHGARTPLSSKYWRGLVPEWDVCGSAFQCCPVLVVSEGGHPRPWNEDDFKQVSERYPGNCSKGELTVEGQLQSLDFGKWLRWRYLMVHPLLPDTHQPGTLQARTTNYARTIATLQGVLTGLYPGTKLPFELTATDEVDEVLYASLKTCGRLKELVKELNRMHKETAAKLAPEVEQVAVAVREGLGLPPEEQLNFVDLHDTITTAVVHGKPLPPVLLDPHVQRVVEFQATKRFLGVLAPHAETGKQQEVLQLSMGRLMQLMLQRMEEAAAGESGAVMHLYSGHDSSIMPLLVALGKDVSHWPPYLSHLVFELWKRPANGEHYVKVLYNRAPLHLSELCPGDGASPAAGCELQAFKQHVLGPYLLSREAHAEQCMVHFHHDRPMGDPGSVEESDLTAGASLQEGAKEKEQWE